MEATFEKQLLNTSAMAEGSLTVEPSWFRIEAIQLLHLKYSNFCGSQTDLHIKYYLILGKSLFWHTSILSNIFDEKATWKQVDNSQQNLSQPMDEALAYLHMQISPISCNVVGSILHVLVKNTDTAIVGQRLTGVGGHHALYC